MTEEELQMLEQCLAVLKFINKHMGTALELEQMTPSAKDIRLKNGDRVLYRDSLAACRVYIGGMLLLTEIVSGVEL